MAKLAISLKMLLVIKLAWLLLLPFAFGQEENAKPEPQPPKRADPVQSFLSDIGNLVLTADETFGRITAPKVNTEREIKQQLLGVPQRVNVLDRLRQNLNRRVTQDWGIPAELPSLSDLIPNINIQNKGQKAFVDVSVPFAPVRLTVNSRPKMGHHQKHEQDGRNVLPGIDLPDFRSNLQVGKMRIDVESPESGMLPNVKIGADKTDTHLPEESGKQFSARRGTMRGGGRHSGDLEGRIIGDLLYSESQFDSKMKDKLKKNKWAIDPKLPKLEKLKKVKPFNRNRYRGDRYREDPYEQDHYRGHYRDEYYRRQGEISEGSEHEIDRVLLAFSPDGVPLKLKFGPEVENPLVLLNQYLTDAGASLNVPVEYEHEMEPAGNEVLLLGSGRGDILAETVTVNMSDPKELRNFLKVLRKAKSPML